MTTIPRYIHKKIQQVTPGAEELKLPELTNQWSSVKELSVSASQNAKWRPSMEDEHVLVDKFGGKPYQGYFAIYDGHGGTATAQYIATYLHQNFEEELKKTKIVEDALKNSYLLTDRALLSKKIPHGSTAVSVFVTIKPDGRWLYTANCGDSRAVLCRDKKAVRLSFDHKPADPSEKTRIEDLQGFVGNGKIAGVLSVSRAFGDAELKKWVTPEPFVSTTKLSPTDTHVIIACDGLWDVVTDQEAVDLIVTEDDAKTMSQKLLDYALSNDTKDNLSIIVITL